MRVWGDSLKFKEICQVFAWVALMWMTIPSADSLAQAALNLDVPLHSGSDSIFSRVTDIRADKTSLFYGLRLDLQYANQNLVLLLDDDGNDVFETRSPVVEDWYQGRLTFEWVPADKLRVTVRSPAFVYNLQAGVWDGTGFRKNLEASNGFSDGWVDVSYELLRLGQTSLGARLAAPIPIGSAVNYAAHESMAVYPELAARSRIANKITIALNLGAAVLTEQVRVRTFELDQAITWRAGVAYTLNENIALNLEGVGATRAIKPFGNVRYSPTEIGIGSVFRLGGAFAVKPFVAAGLIPGIGSGRYRGGLSVSYVQGKNPVQPEDNAVIDSDEDGIDDAFDQCPQEPEDFNEIEDEDGCPEKDTDGDGLIDQKDACVDQPEDLDDFEDEDGCPDVDNDQDTFPDNIDRCPNKAEDMDQYEDEDGCPEIDNDGDGLPDTKDKCPYDAEVINSVDDEDGCPDEGGTTLAEVKDEKIELREKIYFPSNKDTIRERSYRLLNQVTSLLRNHQGILKVRIEGHTDSSGDESWNQKLSQKRAEAVRRYLINKGIARKRLEAIGFGSKEPRAKNNNPKGRGKNRRVEFIILQRSEDSEPLPPKRLKQ